jgi:glutamine amidotransferase
MTAIAIVDYGLGNLFSVKRAFQSLGAEAIITSEPESLNSVDGVVLPGVGAFGEGMRNLAELGLASELRRLAAAGKPILGICLGMQLLMDESEELGRWDGLGLLPGRVVRLNPSEHAKVPQIGWNSIDAPVGIKRDWSGTILDGISGGEHMYFVHSFCVFADRPQDALAETDYAGSRFCAVAVRDNVAGTQFHPEKSGAPGIKVISNWLALVSGPSGDQL